jgi:hypothetical protein
MTKRKITPDPTFPPHIDCLGSLLFYMESAVLIGVAGKFEGRRASDILCLSPYMGNKGFLLSPDLEWKYALDSIAPEIITGTIRVLWPKDRSEIKFYTNGFTLHRWDYTYVRQPIQEAPQKVELKRMMPAPERVTPEDVIDDYHSLRRWLWLHPDAIMNGNHRGNHFECHYVRVYLTDNFLVVEHPLRRTPLTFPLTSGLTFRPDGFDLGGTLNFDFTSP